MDKATPDSAPASIDSVMRLKKLLSDIAAMLSPTADSYASDDPSGAIETAYSVAVEAIDICAEVERLAAQSAPTEIHADTPRHELLPRLRRLASDFQSHPLSRSISECEEAGIAMAEAAKQIEMLRRTRNTVVNHSGRMRKEIAALTEHRDFLLREIAKIDGDPGNACHYAIEAISAVCADLAEPVPPLPEPEPTYTDDLELRYAEACKERDHLRTMLARSVLSDRAAAQVEPVRMPPEIAAIAERLHTQNNRITQDPLFAVQQKRRIYGVDTDYTSQFEWSVDGETWTPESGEEPPENARRVGYIDIWEFVTGCFTEQGCKDFIACNGHNLKQPRIYAYGSYRNAEFIAMRKWLMSLSDAVIPADGEVRG